MLKKHMAACLVVTAFAAAPAFAQTPAPSAPTDRPTASGSGSTTSGSPAMQPGASGSSSMGSSSTGSSAMSQSGGMQGQFMTQMQQGQMMASDLIGTRVVSTNNESIGDINDVILDRNGQVTAAVVGVGGFLGIGEKNVAVPFQSLEFASRQQANAMDQKANGNNVATTGSTATGQGSAATADNSASSNEPERVILRMTKAELQAAPVFKADGDRNANRSDNNNASGNATTAPKQ